MDDGDLAGVRALVVEDEYFVADDLKWILKRRGASAVRLSGNVGDALGQIRSGAFDVALVDINVHGEMAFSVADELRRLGVPFGFVSACPASSIPPRFAGIPNWGKPYDEAEVAAGVRRLAARRAGAGLAEAPADGTPSRDHRLPPPEGRGPVGA